MLYLLSSDKSDLIDDESDDDGFNSGSSGKYAFSLSFKDSVGHISGLGFGIFSLIRVNSKCDIVVFVLFMSIGVKYKGVRPIELFGAHIHDFPSKFLN